MIFWGREQRTRRGDTRGDRRQDTRQIKTRQKARQRKDKTSEGATKGGEIRVFKRTNPTKSNTRDRKPPDQTAREDEQRAVNWGITPDFIDPVGPFERSQRRMACQAFSADSFAPLTLDSPLPILMHHAATSDGLPTTSHAHSMVSPGKLASGGLLPCRVKLFFCRVILLFMCATVTSKIGVWQHFIWRPHPSDAMMMMLFEVWWIYKTQRLMDVLD